MNKSITVTITTETWGVKVSHPTTLAEALVVARAGVRAIERRLLEDPTMVVEANDPGDHAPECAVELPEGWEATRDGVSIATVDGVVTHSRTYRYFRRGEEPGEASAPCNKDGSPSEATVLVLRGAVPLGVDDQADVDRAARGE